MRLETGIIQLGIIASMNALIVYEKSQCSCEVAKASLDPCSLTT